MNSWLGYGVLFVWSSIIISAPFFVQAQEYANTAVASSLPISGLVNDGDVVSYDVTGDRYVRSDTLGDESVFGIVVDDPLLYVVGNEALPGARPLIRSGEATVNVTTLGGVIRAGDLISTSPIAGLGQRVPRDAGIYMLGIALADMQRATTSRADLPENIQYGRVPVALRMGLYLPESDVRTATVTQNIINGAETNSREADYFNIFRYILAALVALAAIIIALRSFGGTLAQSVISIGRNPLARKTIISMMLWNSFLIVVVSGVGLGLAIAILLL
jgi:hypothetical protein